MTVSSWVRRALAAVGVMTLAAVTATVQARSPQASAAQGASKPAEEEFVPQVGQAGKDVVWVPTPPELVEAMLDMAKVTPQDYVIDLGSGDGRNVIAAARRGARALGVEYNPKMVALSTRNAAAAGLAGRAAFVEGDMYEADISKASVMALFLLPSNMLQLRPKFLDLRPGSRIVSNTFGIEGWTPDETRTIEGNCSAWCTALLWIVPAKVGGKWRLGDGELMLEQEYQMVKGALDAKPLANGRLRGDQIRFVVGTTEYTGRVDGNRIEGNLRGGGPATNWTATRAN
ncbi:MAG: RNA methyltransferase [Acidobacteria bacterium RIFCSPLOWO2_02_FULL_68_18]|nr:MAG: RNA methyltransferase [Acidobacteria bacterium RIFCSPLOWO2_02_FULL_68_18]OFW49185.1 MAG: RNA methyltransferase [Acidobacteria bacterium RIFCSPLOWO2_12_FULL_68_19]